jgi:hypothetical protein
LKTLSPGKQPQGQNKIRHWYWASIFMYRYSGSTESTSAKDFQDVSAWMLDDNLEPDVISEFSDRYISIDLRSEFKRNTAAYNGVFNLYRVGGAKDWVSNEIPHSSDLDDHHIVPASWEGKDKLEDGRRINSILNRTPMTAKTNREIIRDRLPNEYLPEWIKDGGLNGRETVEAIMETHFISKTALDILLRKPFEAADFEEFIDERQATIKLAIQDLLIKNRMDLSPHLRELDVAIEVIERSIRAKILNALDGDVELLPSHLIGKVGGRIEAVLKKNPSHDKEQLRSLEGQLEFFDLRELQDTILSKALWALFSTAFGSKEALANRFGQLAELRNGIAHNRAVTDVTRKDGEAAILWFNKVLGII